MVLTFFMLSGYVIGLNYLNKFAFNTLDYLKKRWVRLYPIYLIAIVITIILFSASTKEIVFNLLFGQNIFSDVLKDNNPLWSLNHEVVYYLLAIPLLKFRIQLKYLFPILIILLAVSVFKFPFPRIIEGYLVGFFFWLTGFAISKLKFGQSPAAIKKTGAATNQLMAIFLLLLACDFLNVLNVGISKIPFLHGASYTSLDGMVYIGDFSSYLFCLYVILVAASIKPNWFKYLIGIVYVSCWAHLLVLVAKGSFFKHTLFYLPAFFLCISTLLLFISKPVVKSLSIWSYAGGISYALYVIHMPLLRAMGRINFFTGTNFSFVMRLMVFLVVVIGLAHLLERWMQPFIKQLFFSRKNIQLLKETI